MPHPKEVSCPWCNEPSGWPCRYPSGKRYPGWHEARRAAAHTPAQAPLLTQPCPTCGAAPGCKCVKPGTREQISGIHTARMELEGG